MRQAPPADAACASGRWWRWLQLLLNALAAGTAAAWLAALSGATAAPTALAALLAAAAAGWLAAHALPLPAGRLRWDGSGWWLDEAPGAAQGQAVAGQAKPVFDFGPWLLVRFDPTDAGAAAARWLAFSDARIAAQPLRPLRVALHGAALLASPAAAERL